MENQVERRQSSSGNRKALPPTRSNPPAIRPVYSGYTHLFSLVARGIYSGFCPVFSPCYYPPVLWSKFLGPRIDCNLRFINCL